MAETELKTKFDGEEIIARGKRMSAREKELIWEWLKADRYVAEVCGARMDWEEFEAAAVRFAERLLEARDMTRPSGRTRRLPLIDLSLTDSERQQARALAPYLAKRAALLPEVQSFRQEKLDGGTLPDPEQLVAFLRSEMSGFPVNERTELDWALDQIPSYLDDYELEEVEDLVGGYENRGIESQDRFWRDNIQRAIEAESLATSYVPSSAFMHGIMHLIDSETGGTLEDVGRLLTSRYPWPLRDAAWFVLTDEPPEIEPLEVSYDSALGTYRITFAPWISEETMMRAYHSIHDKDNRPLRAKGLTVFRFVDEHTEPGRTPKWAELTERWNKQHPDKKFTDRSALRKAYKRAEERLASPWAPSKSTRADTEVANIVEPNDPFEWVPW